MSISFGGFHFCSGAAISDTFVLTAGSCLAIFDKDTTLDVVFADGQWTTSSETIVHPDFDSASLFADSCFFKAAGHSDSEFLQGACSRAPEACKLQVLLKIISNYQLA